MRAVSQRQSALLNGGMGIPGLQLIIRLRSWVWVVPEPKRGLKGQVQYEVI